MLTPDYKVGYDVGVTYYGYIGAKSNFTNPYNNKTGLAFTEVYGKLILQIRYLRATASPPESITRQITGVAPMISGTSMSAIAHRLQTQVLPELHL